MAKIKDDDEDDQGDLDDAISLDKTIRKRVQTTGGLMSTHKQITASRYLSDSRYAAISEHDPRVAQKVDGENVRR